MNPVGSTSETTNTPFLRNADGEVLAGSGWPLGPRVQIEELSNNSRRYGGRVITQTRYIIAMMASIDRPDRTVYAQTVVPWTFNFTE